MVGLPVDKNVIDGRVGNLAWQLRETLDQVRTVKAWLDARTDQDLIDLGYDSGEVAVLKSAFTDLDKLARVAHGDEVQAEASDFFFWASRLTGLQ